MPRCPVSNCQSNINYLFTRICRRQYKTELKILFDIFFPYQSEILVFRYSYSYFVATFKFRQMKAWPKEWRPHQPCHYGLTLSDKLPITALLDTHPATPESMRDIHVILNFDPVNKKPWWRNCETLVTMASSVTTLGLCLVLLSCLLATSDAEPRHFDHDPDFPRPYYPKPRPSKQDISIPIKPIISKPDISCSFCKETCFADCDECDQCTLCSLCFGST